MLQSLKEALSTISNVIRQMALNVTMYFKYTAHGLVILL